MYGNNFGDLEDNIKMGVRKGGWEGVDCFCVLQDKGQRRLL